MDQTQPREQRQNHRSATTVLNLPCFKKSLDAIQKGRMHNRQFQKEDQDKASNGDSGMNSLNNSLAPSEPRFSTRKYMHQNTMKYIDSKRHMLGRKADPSQPIEFLVSSARELRDIQSNLSSEHNTPHQFAKEYAGQGLESNFLSGGDQDQHNGVDLGQDAIHQQPGPQANNQNFQQNAFSLDKGGPLVADAKADELKLDPNNSTTAEETGKLPIQNTINLIQITNNAQYGDQALVTHRQNQEPEACLEQAGSNIIGVEAQPQVEQVNQNQQEPRPQHLIELQSDYEQKRKFESEVKNEAQNPDVTRNKQQLNKTEKASENTANDPHLDRNQVIVPDRTPNEAQQATFPANYGQEQFVYDQNFEAMQQNEVTSHLVLNPQQDDLQVISHRPNEQNFVQENYIDLETVQEGARQQRDIQGSAVDAPFVRGQPSPEVPFQAATQESKVGLQFQQESHKTQHQDLSSQFRGQVNSKTINQETINDGHQQENGHIIQQITIAQSQQLAATTQNLEESLQRIPECQLQTSQLSAPDDNDYQLSSGCPQESKNLEHGEQQFPEHTNKNQRPQVKKLLSAISECSEMGDGQPNTFTADTSQNKTLPEDNQVHEAQNQREPIQLSPSAATYKQETQEQESLTSSEAQKQAWNSEFTSRQSESSGNQSQSMQRDGQTGFENCQQRSNHNLAHSEQGNFCQESDGRSLINGNTQDSGANLQSDQQDGLHINDGQIFQSSKHATHDSESQQLEDRKDQQAALNGTQQSRSASLVEAQSQQKSLVQQHPPADSNEPDVGKLEIQNDDNKIQFIQLGDQSFIYNKLAQNLANLRNALSAQRLLDKSAFEIKRLTIEDIEKIAAENKALRERKESEIKEQNQVQAPKNVINSIQESDSQVGRQPNKDDSIRQLCMDQGSQGASVEEKFGNFVSEPQNISNYGDLAGKASLHSEDGQLNWQRSAQSFEPALHQVSNVPNDFFVSSNDLESNSFQGLAADFSQQKWQQEQGFQDQLVDWNQEVKTVNGESKVFQFDQTVNDTQVTYIESSRLSGPLEGKQKRQVQFLESEYGAQKEGMEQFSSVKVDFSALRKLDEEHQKSRPKKFKSTTSVRSGWSTMSMQEKTQQVVVPTLGFGLGTTVGMVVAHSFLQGKMKLLGLLPGAGAALGLLYYLRPKGEEQISQATEDDYDSDEANEGDEEEENETRENQKEEETADIFK